MRVCVCVWGGGLPQGDIQVLGAVRLARSGKAEAVGCVERRRERGGEADKRERIDQEGWRGRPIRRR